MQLRLASSTVNHLCLLTAKLRVRFDNFNTDSNKYEKSVSFGGLIHKGAVEVRSASANVLQKVLFLQVDENGVQNKIKKRKVSTKEPERM